MNRSEISAVDYATASGKIVDTSSVTPRGQAFPVIKRYQQIKTLRVRMCLIGDCSAEKQYVMEETARRVEAVVTN